MFVCWFIITKHELHSVHLLTPTQRSGVDRILKPLFVLREGWETGDCLDPSGLSVQLSGELSPLRPSRPQLIFCYLCAQRETLNCKHFTLKRNLNSSAVVRVFSTLHTCMMLKDLFCGHRKTGHSCRIFPVRNR